MSGDLIPPNGDNGAYKETDHQGQEHPQNQLDKVYIFFRKYGKTMVGILIAISFVEFACVFLEHVANVFHGPVAAFCNWISLSGQLFVIGLLAFKFTKWRKTLWVIIAGLCVLMGVNIFLNWASVRSGPQNPQNVSAADSKIFQAQLSAALKEALKNQEASVADSPFNISYSGISINFMIRFGPSIKGRDNYIFDCGQTLNKNRLSVFLNTDDALVLKVYDQGSMPTEIKVQPSLETFNFDSPQYIVCEFGMTNNFSFLRIVINGKQVAEEDHPWPIQIFNPGGSRFFVGSDMNARQGGVFMLGEMFVTKQTISHDGLIQLLHYFDETTATNGACWVFTGVQSMATAPNKPLIFN
jgi:hypothetical protein